MYVCWWLEKSYPRTQHTYADKKPNPARQRSDPGPAVAPAQIPVVEGSAAPTEVQVEVHPMPSMPV